MVWADMGETNATEVTVAATKGRKRRQSKEGCIFMRGTRTNFGGCDESAAPVLRESINLTSIIIVTRGVLARRPAQPRRVLEEPEDRDRRFPFKAFLLPIKSAR